jgi:hypothetical protein
MQQQQSKKRFFSELEHHDMWSPDMHRAQLGALLHSLLLWVGKSQRTNFHH